MIRRALLTAAAVLLWLPATAAAAPDTIINFEGLPLNQDITNQYSAQGVNFGKAESFGFPQPDHTCSVPEASAATEGINGTESAMIACYTGSDEFPDRMLGASFEFGTERRVVSFDLEQATSAASETATVDFYAIGGTLLNEQTITLPENGVVHVSYAHATTDGGIVGVVISGDMDTNDTGKVYLDNIDATLDDTPPAKKFSLALATPSIDVVEGSTGQATLSVRRYNGSTGPVTLSTGSLPPDINAASFTPNPVSGTNPTTLTVSAGSPFSGQRQISITATGSAQAGTAINTSLVQTVNGVPAITIPSGGLTPIRLVPGCGQQTVTQYFNVQGDYAGTVYLVTDDTTGGVAVNPGQGDVTASGNGVYPVQLDLNPGTADGSGTFDFKLYPNDATPAQLTLNWLTDRVRVDSVSPTTPGLPVIDGGSTVTVVGNFPSQCSVSFVDGAGQTWPIAKRDSVEVNGQQDDAFTLGLPATAVSGPLRVLSPSGGELARTAPVDVLEFRQVDGLSQLNGGDGAVGTYDWNDFVNQFGTSQTVDCFIICVRDPTALKYYHRYSDSVTAGTGLCFGYAIMAERFRDPNSGQRPSDYQPGATEAWQIAPTTDGTAVKRDIVSWFVSQNDENFIESNSAEMNKPPDEKIAALENAIKTYGSAPISILSGTQGHEVTAYAVQPRVALGGGVILSVYDPNLPYTTAEETNSGVRQGVLATSTIAISQAGNWSGTSEGWVGNNSTIGVNEELPPVHARLPITFSLASILGSAGGPPPATVEGIQSGGKALLNADYTPIPGSGVTMDASLSGASAQPTYILSPGRTYTLAVRGDTSGAFDEGLVGRDAAATVSGAHVTSGEVDQLTLQPGQATLQFQPGASTPVSYDLIKKVGNASQTASITLTEPAGAGDQTSLNSNTLQIIHHGPSTTATITLGFAGTALPGSVQTVPITLGRDQRLDLTPHAWSNLSAGIGYTVQSGTGKVLRRGRVRLRTTTKVALSTVRARRRGTKLTVTGVVTRPGSAPLLAVVAEVRHGHHLVRRRTVSTSSIAPTGRFSLSVNVGKVPRGALVGVQVILIDQADADLASVKRGLTVR